MKVNRLRPMSATVTNEKQPQGGWMSKDYPIHPSIFASRKKMMSASSAQLPPSSMEDQVAQQVKGMKRPGSMMRQYKQLMVVKSGN